MNPRPQMFYCFVFKGISPLPRVLQLYHHLKPIWECHCIFLSTRQSLLFLKRKPWRKPWRATSSEFLVLDTYPQFCKNKSMVSPKELGTPVNSTGLLDLPLGANKNVIDLLCHATSIAVPSPAERLTSLGPGNCSPKSSCVCKVQE